MVECKSLKKIDTFGKSDPFVSILLVPGDHKEMKTKVVKKNLNPVFDEVFKCEVSLPLIFALLRLSLKLSLSAARKLTLVFRVFDWDMFKDSDEMGEVIAN